MNLSIKQGDTRHAIKAALKDAKGNVVDLTGARVRFVMAKSFTSRMIDREVPIVDNQVMVVFEPGETDEAGKMMAEFRVTYPDGKTETFPTESYITISIQKTLGGV
ncbi:hypothetical protein [Planomicrobium sp. CPCC 101079]|uniref:hypothetical protein n=1 Tax=Planomicrobium sp. CPCC 101079 TaxID=2599618 RepID=UPI0011B520D7|nr:hypothetical protein [Planomicrobium sp. CPCC 101079]TWT04592.1 hypothetical protein FQV28_08290 [Planomicrobium sp. CPCC 101079]